MPNVFEMSLETGIKRHCDEFFMSLGYENKGFSFFHQVLELQNEITINAFYNWIMAGASGSLYLDIQNPKDFSATNLLLKRKDDSIEVQIEQNPSPQVKPNDRKIEFWDEFKRCFSEGVMFTDTEGTIIEISDRTTEILNKNEVLGTNLRTHVDEWTDKALVKFMHDSRLSSDALHFERTLEYGDKFLEIKGYTLDDEKRPRGYMFLLFDVTKRIELEKKLHRSQESISAKSHFIVLGELAGKIAHEVNTPLAAILLTSSLGKSVAAGPTQIEEMRRKFTMIENTSVMIGEIIKNLLTFSRRESSVENSEIFLKDLLEEVFSVAGIGLKNHDMTWTTDVTDDCVFEGKKIQIQQIFMNLISNSISAIKNQKEKWIRVKARVADQKIEICVTDSGDGVPQDIADKIMTEYFSTKELGEGLGIGLSICKSVIHGHGGSISLDTESPNTCFKIIFPLSQSFSKKGKAA